MGWRSARPHRVNGGSDLVGEPAYTVVTSRGWRADRRFAVGCSVVFFGITSLLDWGLGALTAPYLAVWGAATVLVLAVLWPPRVVAGRGWLAVHSLLRTRTVRTDALVDARRIGEVAVSLVLRDVHGGRVELTPGVLTADPVLWHLLDAGIRRSQERGTLRTGTQVLYGIGERVDGEAEAILRASGLR